MSAPDEAVSAAIVALLSRQRWATLATTFADGLPTASAVAYAWAPGRTSLLLHVSTLAAHTRNLLERPRCAMVVGEADDQRDDPQTLARLTLNLTAALVSPEMAGYERSRSAYLSRLPTAAARFDFADFMLLELNIGSAHYVGGFAAAYRLDAQWLQRWLGAT